MSSPRECGVCWYVYQPELGDDVWQVPAGTAFEALPEHWRCPRCDSGQDRFVPVVAPPPTAEAPPAPQAVAAPGGVPGLVAAYQRAELRMRGLPVVNSALSVEAVGFRPVVGGQLGVVVTPWFMSLVFLPDGDTLPVLREGEQRIRPLPSGEVQFVGARLDGVGPFESCSLFSPMFEFESAAAARQTAEQALLALFTAPQPVAAASPGKTPSRRELFTRLARPR